MTEVSPAKENPLDVFLQKRAMLDNEASLAADTQSWINAKIGAILSAGSFEEINALMSSTGLTAARDMIGRTLVIRDFATRESATAFRNTDKRENGYSALEKFAIVQAVDASDGEEFIIDGGGDQFVAGLVAMRDLYDFPFTGTLLALGTQSGYDLQYWRFIDPAKDPARKDKNKK